MSQRQSLASGLRSLCSQQSLLRSLAWRDIEARYRGTALGFSWAIFHPLLMLSVYAFVFGGIFQSRWATGGSGLQFVQMLYCGLIVHGLCADTLTRAPSALVAQPNYVKKVVFPLELLPMCHVLSALFNAVISIGLLLLLVLWDRQGLPLTIALIPVVLAPLALLISGLAWLLAAVGMFLRDIGQVVNVGMAMLLFLSPVFYPANAAPLAARKLIFLNPLTYPMEALRSVAILGTAPDWWDWSLYSLASLVVAVLGLACFQRARPIFADVV